MNLAAIKAASILKANSAALQVQKYSPQILTGVGIVSMLGAVGMGIKATTHLNEVLDEFDSDKNNLVQIRALRESGEIAEEKFTDKQIQAATVGTYLKLGIGIAKLYWPTIAMAAGGTVCILAGHHILNKRYVGVVAAYNLVDSAFKDYRRRIIEEFGEDVDLSARTGGSKVETIIDEASGEKRKVITRSEDSINGPGGYSQYARFFGRDYTDRWQREAGYNQVFIKSITNTLNDTLRIRGHVFLNEVYDALGFERTRAGAVVGWLLHGDGDGYIDFGLTRHIMDGDDPATLFIEGAEREVWLDPNVDGVIWDKI